MLKIISYLPVAFVLQLTTLIGNTNSKQAFPVSSRTFVPLTEVYYMLIKFCSSRNKGNGVLKGEWVFAIARCGLFSAIFPWDCNLFGTIKRRLLPLGNNSRICARAINALLGRHFSWLSCLKSLAFRESLHPPFCRSLIVLGCHFLHALASFSPLL